jgi:hypothetical protein
MKLREIMKPSPQTVVETTRLGEAHDVLDAEVRSAME